MLITFSQIKKNDKDDENKNENNDDKDDGDVEDKNRAKLLYFKDIRFNYKKNENFSETEVNVLAKLENPAILQFYGVGEIILNGHTYPAIITEYMPNDTLKSVLEKEM